MKRKNMLLLTAAGAVTAYAAALFGSTGIIHGYANQAIEPIAARNVITYATAPIFAGVRAKGEPLGWGEQQRKIAFRVLAGGVMVDWTLSHGFNRKGQANAALLNGHNIALLPELDRTAQPALTIDGAAGCINLPPAASPLANAGHVDALLTAYNNSGRRAGTYSFIGDGSDRAIFTVSLPPGHTAARLCTDVRPVLPQHHAHG